MSLAMQVLTYMRTGVRVGGREVMSIVLGEKDLNLRHPASSIQAAIRSLEWGLPSDSKDFLDPSKCVGSVITRKTSQRKRAAHIYLSKLPQKLQDAIKNGMYTDNVSMAHFCYTGAHILSPYIHYDGLFHS